MHPNAAVPLLGVVRIEHELLGAGQQLLKHHPRLEPCQARPDAMVCAAPEAEVEMSVRAVDHDAIWVLEHRRVPVR